MDGWMNRLIDYYIKRKDNNEEGKEGKEEKRKER